MRPSRQGLLLSCQDVTTCKHPAFYGLLVMATLLLDPVIASHAQPSDTVHRRLHLTDYIVINSNDTITADIVASPSPAAALDSVLWTPSKIVVKGKTCNKEFTSRDLKAFCFANVHYESITLPTSSQAQFCRRIFDGHISIFSCQSISSSIDGWTEASVLYLRHNDSLQAVRAFSFPTSLVSKDTLSATYIHGPGSTDDELLAAAHAFNRLLAPKTSH